MLEIKRKEEASKSEKQVGGNNRNVFLIFSGGGGRVGRKGGKGGRASACWK